MKITITKKHEYLSGWTAYDMTWKTEVPRSLSTGEEVPERKEGVLYGGAQILNVP